MNHIKAWHIVAVAVTSSLGGFVMGHYAPGEVVAATLVLVLIFTFYLWLTR